MKEKTIQFIKQLQTELDNRTKVEEKAQDLMKNGKFKEATELLKTLNDEKVEQLFDLSVKEEVKAGYKDFLNKKYEEFKLFLNQKGFCPDSEEEVWKMYGKAFNKSSGACNFAKDMIQIQQYDETGKLNELDIFLNEIQRKYLSCCEDYIASMCADSKKAVKNSNIKRDTLDKIDKAIEKVCSRIREEDRITSLAEETKALAELITARAQLPEKVLFEFAVADCNANDLIEKYVKKIEMNRRNTI